MGRVVRISLVGLAATTIALLPVAPAASAGPPIRAGQHFLGLVNGSHRDPVVKTVCPGPVSSTRTGPVAGNQTMSVVHVRKGHGYTGLFDSVYAWFQPTTAKATPTQLRFRNYATPKLIPSSIRVPCGGSGTVVFSSCPYLAPCAAGWVTTNVTVRFEDIAA
jgi:hypothetical protein